MDEFKSAKDYKGKVTETSVGSVESVKKAKRDRTLYIVELRNGNWHTLTRIKEKAERELNRWNRLYPGDATLIIMVIPDAKNLHCVWSLDKYDEGVWETLCGNTFIILDGKPSDNEMMYCCYCGRLIKEKKNK